jgi:putative secretion ATPase (PEP-CTERM system associated)
VYESYYKLSAKPFQLKPDPDFFFGSKGHKRALSYLQYGLSQEEGFVVITGEVGAGKTTLLRSLLRSIEHENILVAQIVNTNIDANDTLKMVAAAFGLPYEQADKADLLIRLEQFLRQRNDQGVRALLVVDEAQNLSPNTVEELRMLSNFQTNDKSLLQIFLLGQPEFRKTLLRSDMQQLQQRVIATYHLGPLDALETRDYIEHRLHKVGWNGDPALSVDAYYDIYNFTTGIPRKINTLCDRLFLLGYLEERHIFRSADVTEVINDIKNEFSLPADIANEISVSDIQAIENKNTFSSNFGDMDDRLFKMEKSVINVLDLFKQILSRPNINDVKRDKFK